MPQHYFSHDNNASSDEKILELRAEHGWEGYGLFWALIERMARLEDGTIDPDKAAVIAMDIGVDKDKLYNVVQTCIEAGIFVEDKEGIYRNKRITAHIEKMEAYREAGRKGAKKRWSKKSDRGANREGNANKIKGDNTKLNNTTELQREDVPNKPPVKEDDDFSDVEAVEVSEGSNV